MNILIVSPMQRELAFLSHGLMDRGLKREDDLLGRLPIVRFPEIGVTLACGGTGKAQFALQTQHLLDIRSAWDLVVCAGAAGGLVDELAVGDVVVATETVEHDYNNKFGNTPLPCAPSDFERNLELAMKNIAVLVAGWTERHVGRDETG